MRRLAICVDDVGVAPGVVEAVERLAAQGRVQAASCLVAAEGWRRDAPRVAALAPDVDIGVHLSLTEGAPLSAALARAWPRLPTLGRLLAAAHLHLLPRAAIRDEIAAQLAAFADATGAAPAFVDGHQHVHHLPVVRDIVLEAIAAIEPRPAMRSTGRIVGPGFAFKRAVIEATGGRALRRDLMHRRVRTNGALTGVYDFEAADYRSLVRGWMRELPAEGALLFCHPSMSGGPTTRDPIATARVREFDYLASEAFAADLAAAGVVLGRVWQPLSETTTPG